MNKLKLMTIVGTRPELIRLSETIKKADMYFNHVFVHTGQNYDSSLNDIFYDDLGLRKPDFYLNVVDAGEAVDAVDVVDAVDAGDADNASENNLGKTMGNIIAKSYEIMSKVKPDALLILGDTNSCLSAISAKRLKIPIFHMEAGNRCFDENLPEEINRRIVDHISDVNLPYTEHARRYLISEGVRKEFIFVTGSPMAEVILANVEKINNSQVMTNFDLNNLDLNNLNSNNLNSNSLDLNGSDLKNLDLKNLKNNLKLEEKKYIVLSAHREENLDIKENFFSIMNGINDLADYYKLPIIYSAHPRSAKLIKKHDFKFRSNVHKLKPFAFTDYINLQKNAFCVVSDSGTLPEEAAILGFPAVSLRTSTERPEALDKGRFVIGGIKSRSILSSVDMAVKMFDSQENPRPVPDYEVYNVSSKVVQLIQGYTDIVNRAIWQKL